MLTRGRFYAFELKRETGIVTAIQQETLKHILREGGMAAVLRHVDHLKLVLDEQ